MIFLRSRNTRSRLLLYSEGSFHLRKSPILCAGHKACAQGSFVVITLLSMRIAVPRGVRWAVFSRNKPGGLTWGITLRRNAARRGGFVTVVATVPLWWWCRAAHLTGHLMNVSRETGPESGLVPCCSTAGSSKSFDTLDPEALDSAASTIWRGCLSAVVWSALLRRLRVECPITGAHTPSIGGIRS